MAVSRPLKLPPRPTGLAAVVQRRNLPTIGLVAIVLALAILIGHDVFFPPAATTAATQTATVADGTVTNSVTASGTVVPAQQMSLGFKTPGTLTEVDVMSGAHVSAGQVLAKIDDTALQLALQTAQASLASAQATLSNTLSGTTLQQASDSLNQARQSYTDAVNTANQNSSADNTTLNADLATQSADVAAVAADNAALTFSVLYQNDLKQTALDQSQLVSDTAAFNSLLCASTFPLTPACDTALAAVRADQNKINADKLQTTNDQNAAAPNYAADQAKITPDATKVTADYAKVSADNQAGQRSIQQAQNAVTNAQDAYNAQSVTRPATIQQQQAMVSSASAQVDTAQNNLNGAVLTAPMAGVISSLSAQVGDTVSAANASSGAEAPGTTRTPALLRHRHRHRLRHGRLHDPAQRQELRGDRLLRGV